MQAGRGLPDLPDILTDTLKADCQYCFQLLRRYGLDPTGFNKDGWSLLGFALTEGAKKIGIYLTQVLDKTDHLKGYANVIQIHHISRPSPEHSPEPPEESL